MKIAPKDILCSLALVCVALSCAREIPNNPDSGAFEGEVVLTSQAQVDAFQAISSLHVLTVTGKDITDLSPVDVHALDKLIVTGTSIKTLENPSFAYINDRIEISSNDSLVSVKSLGTKYCTGNIAISKNPILSNIEGLLSLKKMTGTISITGNKSLGADNGSAGKTYGFNVLRELMDNYIVKAGQIILVSNHPEAVTDPDRIGKGKGEYYSYVIRSAEDLKNIATGECEDFTLMGPAVNDDVWRAIPSKGLKTIHGNLYAEGCDFTMLSAVFKAVSLEGGMTLRHFVSYDTGDWKKYINSDLVPVHLHGDLVLDSLLIHGWAGAGFNNMEEIDGNLSVTDCKFNSDAMMAKCTKVHGDVIFSGITFGLNSKRGPGYFAVGFEEIGGDLVISDNPYLNSLGGFESIRKIGGRVIIRDNGSKELEDAASEGIPDKTASGRTGFDLVQQWIFDEVVAPDKVECYRADGTPVEFDTRVPEDWVITSMADLDAVRGDNLVAKSLTLRGASVTEAVWEKLKTKFIEVQGDLVCDGCSFTMCSKFFKGVSCKGSITFRDMANAADAYLNTDLFPVRIYGDLTLENVNIHGWDGAGLNMVEQIDGNLTVKTRMLGASSCFAKLRSVGGDVLVRGVRNDLFDALTTRLNWSLQTVGGSFSIVNCALEDLSCFGKMTKAGSVYIRDTHIEDFSLVQDWIECGIVRLDDVECYDILDRPVKFEPSSEDLYPDYAVVAEGRDAILALAVQPRTSYRFLVLDGNGETIPDSDMVRLKNGIDTVSEMLIFKNIAGWSMIEQVICSKTPRITPAGGLKFLECPDLSNLNGLKWMTAIEGDLVFRNCPKAVWNWGEGNCLNQIVQIKGDFTIKNSAQGLSGTSCLKSLEKVGGNLTIENNSVNFTSLNGMPLKEIGGNFRYVGNSLVNSLAGFSQVTKVGGNILVKGTAINDFSIIQSWIDNSVTTRDRVQCYNASGVKVSFN
ncbi:MAG: hypothetical protein MJY62_02130 [Bacteroidales bacterium]|nr:hypothetical protein [Bacteroidales bacterium]